LKRTLFTLNNILIILGLFTIIFFLFLHILFPSLFNNLALRVLIAILVVGVMIYFKARDFIRIRDEKVRLKDKELRKKREDVLQRDKTFILKAIENRDIEFLWQKSLEYNQEVYLWDKAEELWQKIRKLDPNGYYGKMAEEKLNLVLNASKR